jgi:nucleoid-associated protein YgaU
MKKTSHAVGLMCLSAAALAAAPTSDDIRRCAAIADSTARLACFDQLSAAPTSAPAASSKKAPVAAPAAAAPAAAAPVAPVAAPAAASLGAETLPKTQEERAATAGPTSLTAGVTGVMATQGNMFRITLDNGQVWQTQEGRSVFTVKPGDTVRVDKRSMGSYQLARVVDGKAGYPVRAIRKQ